MTPSSSGTPTFELRLEPIDPPANASPEPAIAAPVDYVVHDYVEPARKPIAPEPAAKPPDRFVARATKELNDGSVDQRLWDRVLLSAGSDATAARTQYIRARATALRLAARDQRGDAVPPLPAPGSEPPAQAATRRSRRSWTKRASVLHMSIAAAVVGFVGALLWLTASSHDDAPITHAAASAAPRAAARPSADARIAEAVKNADDAAAGEVATALETRVNALEAAGNWNVMVLHATEWTRKQPANALAWSRLAQAYANLRQYQEANDAAMRAAELSPSTPGYWRSVGFARVALEQPDEAAKAFEKAAGLDPHDALSLVQLGVLNTQQKRLPEARVYFDQALAASPDDTGALCGQAVVAQRQGRPRDAEALLSRVKAQDKSCDAAASVGVRVAAAERAPGRPATPARR